MLNVWKCPRCRRSFAKKKQWHSCVAVSIDWHFAGVNPVVRRTYDTLVGQLRELGPLRIDAVKSSINLASRYHFGAVSVRQNHLRLGFILDREIGHERVIRAEKIGPTRVGHSVKLSSPEDVNSQLMEWLSRAYRLQARQ